MDYKMLKWATDEDDKVIVLIDEKYYTNKEAIALRDELVRLSLDLYRIKP